MYVNVENSKTEGITFKERGKTCVYANVQNPTIFQKKSTIVFTFAGSFFFVGEANLLLICFEIYLITAMCCGCVCVTEHLHVF